MKFPVLSIVDYYVDYCIKHNIQLPKIKAVNKKDVTQEVVKKPNIQCHTQLKFLNEAT